MTDFMELGVTHRESQCDFIILLLIAVSGKSAGFRGIRSVRNTGII
jgi:hypothetical protein